MTAQPLVDDPYRLLCDLKGLVALHQRFGIDSYPKTPELARFVVAPPAARPVTMPSLPLRRPEPPLATPIAKEPPPRIVGQTLDEIQAAMAKGCQCPAQAARERIILGHGNHKAALFICGDLPTAQDESDNSPFSGEALVLLTRMLKAIGLELSDVYLTTLIKCLPQVQASPGGGPTPAMIKACLPLLIAQIEAVAPTVICVMGQLATQALLHTQTPLIRLRGRFHTWQQIALMPTFDPGFLLKNPEMKKAAWIDLQLIQAKLGMA
jgi:DNA polymerase